jgi:hypothetical protein
VISGVVGIVLFLSIVAVALFYLNKIIRLVDIYAKLLEKLPFKNLR